MAKEHDFRRIQRFLRGNSGSFPRVILLCGTEGFLIDWAKKEILSKFVSPASKALDYISIDEAELKDMSLVEAIEESCNTYPLLSERKVVVVNNPKMLSQGKYNKKTKSKAEGVSPDTKRTIEIMETMPESTILIFISQDVDKRKKIVREIAGKGEIFDFQQLERNDLTGFAQKRFQANGVTITRDLMNYLIEKTGYYNKESDYNLFTFSNDLVKICALSEESVTKEAIDNTVESDAETFIFDLLDCMSRGKKDRALLLLNNIVGETDDISYYTAMIVGQFEIMYSAKELKDNGVPDRIVIQNIGVNEYRYQKLLPYINKFSKDKLAQILMNAYNIERNVKKGILRSKMALEYFVGSI